MSLQAEGLPHQGRSPYTCTDAAGLQPAGGWTRVPGALPQAGRRQALGLQPSGTFHFKAACFLLPDQGLGQDGCAIGGSRVSC
jgi:hypothetical protein